MPDAQPSVSAPSAPTVPVAPLARAPVARNPKVERAGAIGVARFRVGEQPLYLDTETTGLDGAAEIVEICLVDCHGRPVVDTLVRPRGPIPAGATAVHGITNAMVRSAPSWREVWPEVERAIAGRPVGIYNADYDLRMIRQCNDQGGIVRGERTARAFCIMRLYSRFAGEWNGSRGDYRWHKLEVARAQLGLSLPNSHRARADAELARAVLHAIAEALP